MDNGKTAISSDFSLSIKGLAVLLMVFHHCFGFPEWYIDVPVFLDNGILLEIAKSALICVPVFAFLTGWAYYHHQVKSIQYSAKKIITFLFDYWIVVIPISIFAILFCGYHYTYGTVGEFLPLFPHPLMIFTWYVWFYILMMTVFPIFAIIETEQKKAWRILCFIIILAGILLTAHNYSGLKYLWFWYPSAISGYFIAKYRLFETFSTRIKSKHIAFIIASLFYILSLYIFRWGSFFGESTGYSSAPLFITGSLLLRYAFPAKQFWNTLRYIGQHSMNIWFIHCIFFSSITRGIVQPIVYFRDNPLWIFFITVTVSLAASIVMQPIQKYLNKQILPHLFSLLRL